ncbi:MerR family transcriptional regulator [Apilactobacillus ozensis]|uniref:MerR family transcriptional regulator n=1 Tax=Apilactobacillus ozensis TaxID=866801 RepID=UPI00200AD76E|nr:MerR family transcriptional regulator [Apilactobacillus ozensis]MCK8607081.1 MerR family transcriptional regulator [Apilactobacillus ozensis]
MIPSTVQFKKLIFKIGEVSKMIDVSPRQIRYWESKGCIESLRGNENSSRVYDFHNFMKISSIKYFLDQGYTLHGAIDQTKNHIKNMDFLRKFLEKSYHGIQELDGKMAVNLGFFNAEKSEILYGMLNENDEIEYRVIKK